MSNFAILRVTKKNHMAQVARMARHHLRTHPVPNADPERGIEVLAGAESANDVIEIINGVTKPLAKRKDAVKCFDVLMTASPDYFNKGGDPDAFKKLSMEWAGKTFGVDNIVSAVMHFDEKSPHIQLLIVPIKDGKLQAKHWTGTPGKLRDMQTSFAKALQPLGLERGVMGSEATHKAIRQWYAELAPNMEKAKQLIEDASEVEEKLTGRDVEIAARAEKLDRAGEMLLEGQKELLERSAALEANAKSLADEWKKIDAQAKEISRKEKLFEEAFAYVERQRIAFLEVFNELPLTLMEKLGNFFKKENPVQKPTPKPAPVVEESEEKTRLAAKTGKKQRPG